VVPQSVCAASAPAVAEEVAMSEVPGSSLRHYRGAEAPLFHGTPRVSARLNLGENIGDGEYGGEYGDRRSIPAG
jgi:hypothetical protein